MAKTPETPKTPPCGTKPGNTILFRCFAISTRLSPYAHAISLPDPTTNPDILEVISINMEYCPLLRYSRECPRKIAIIKETKRSKARSSL